MTGQPFLLILAAPAPRRRSRSPCPRGSNFNAVPPHHPRRPAPPALPRHPPSVRHRQGLPVLRDGRPHAHHALVPAGAPEPPPRRRRAHPRPGYGPEAAEHAWKELTFALGTCTPVADMFLWAAHFARGNCDMLSRISVARRAMLRTDTDPSIELAAQTISNAFGRGSSTIDSFTRKATEARQQDGRLGARARPAALHGRAPRVHGPDGRPLRGAHGLHPGEVRRAEQQVADRSPGYAKECRMPLTTRPRWPRTSTPVPSSPGVERFLGNIGFARNWSKPKNPFDFLAMCWTEIYKNAIL